MQRVVRFSLLGLLATAGLTACGDKVTVAPPPSSVTVTPVVHRVTVTPDAATLAPGDKITLAASVDADAGITDRTVSWTTSNAAIAAVDATTGQVTAGTTAGTATVTAAAKADASVKGAALITVVVSGGGAPPTITVSTINTTRCDINGGCTSVPANLGNVAGQIDVTMNVDASSQRLLGVDLVLNCTGNGNSGQDTVVATQTLASSNVTVDAEAASAPVTLSFNTASFNPTTGAVSFRNGSCTLKGRARTNTAVGAPVQTVTSTSSTITLNNQDAVIGSVSSTKTAINPTTGLLWNGGDVTVNATPVMFSGRTPATMTVSLVVDGTTQTQVLTGAGAQNPKWVDGNGATVGNNIEGFTDSATVVTFSLVDSNGQPFTNPASCGVASLCSATSYLANPNNPTAIAKFRLDTQKPKAGNFHLPTNTDQNITLSYVGANFRFASDSAAGYRGPDSTAGNQTRNLDANNAFGPGGTPLPGVDNVTVTFQTAPAGTSKTSSSWANTTNTANLSETTTSTALIERMITTDALGSADTSATTAFGVDKTAPFYPTPTGALNQATSNVLGGTGSISIIVKDDLSGPGGKQLVAQTRLSSTFSTTTTLPADGTIETNGNENNPVSPCVIGRFNTSASSAGPNALPVFERGGTQIGFCTPVAYQLVGLTSVPANVVAASEYATTTIIPVDQAGNTGTPYTVTVAEDNAAPTIGNIDPPGSFTGNATATVAANGLADNVDLVGSYITANYSTPTGGSAINLQYPVTTGPGVAFDNVLTRSGTANPQIPNFIINMQVNSGGAAVVPVRGIGNGDVTSLSVSAIDEVGNVGTLTKTLDASTQLVGGTSPTSTYAPATFTSGFVTTVSTANVSNCPTAGCGPTAAPVAAANPTTVTITATAAGTTNTFGNPFAGGAVGIWYNTGGTAWFFAGNAGTGSARDNGVTRFWDFALAWDPPAKAPDGTNLTPANGGSIGIVVRAIGVNTNGDGIATQGVAVTLTNP